MPSELHVRSGGADHVVGANGLYVKTGGTWQQCNFGYVNVGGVWKTHYIRDTVGPPAPTPSFTISIVPNSSATAHVSIPAHHDALSLNGTTYLQASYTGWGNVWSGNVSGNATSVDLDVSGWNQYSISYRLVTYDELGNYTVGSAAGYQTVDISGPSPLSISLTVTTTGASNGYGSRLRYDWPAFSDLSMPIQFPVVVQVSWGGGSWVTGAQVNSQGAAYWSTIDVPPGNRGQTAVVRMYAIDSLGNISYSAPSGTVWTRPYGAVSLYSNDSQSYTPGVGWRGYTDLVAEVASGTAGAWYYGTALTDYTHGYGADRAFVRMIKYGSDNVGEHNLRLHSDQYRVAGIDWVGGSDITGPTLSTDQQTVDFQLPSDWTASLSSGSSRGIGLIPSLGLRHLYGRFQIIESGMITFGFDF